MRLLRLQLFALAPPCWTWSACAQPSAPSRVELCPKERILSTSPAYPLRQFLQRFSHRKVSRRAFNFKHKSSKIPSGPPHGGPIRWKGWADIYTTVRWGSRATRARCHSHLRSHHAREKRDASTTDAAWTPERLRTNILAENELGVIQKGSCCSVHRCLWHSHAQNSGKPSRRQCHWCWLCGLAPAEGPFLTTCDAQSPVQTKTSDRFGCKPITKNKHKPNACGEYFQNPDSTLLLSFRVSLTKRENLQLKLGRPDLNIRHIWGGGWGCRDPKWDQTKSSAACMDKCDTALYFCSQCSVKISWPVIVDFVLLWNTQWLEEHELKEPKLQKKQCGFKVKSRDALIHLCLQSADNLSGHTTPQKTRTGTLQPSFLTLLTLSWRSLRALSCWCLASLGWRIGWEHENCTLVLSFGPKPGIGVNPPLLIDCVNHSRRS